MADVLATLNRFSEANEAYDTALKTDPRNNETWNKKGLVLARMFLNREAVEAFNQSLQIYPDSAEVWNNMGGALFSQGRMKEALDAFEHAISLDKSYIPQKYEDTLNILESNRDKRAGIAGTEEAVIPEVVSQFLLPPPIFILNYLMIGIGVILIITLGLAQVVHGRRMRKKGNLDDPDNPGDSSDIPSSGRPFED
jgi:tetratricopeptide (TPR) repeat protein